MENRLVIQGDANRPSFVIDLNDLPSLHGGSVQDINQAVQVCYTVTTRAQYTIEMYIRIYIVTCQVHPVLVKRVQCTVCSSFFKFLGSIVI